MTDTVQESIHVGESLSKLIQTSGIAELLRNPQPLIMIAVACLLMYLAIVKKFEPLLLLPISFGMLLANLPLAGMMNPPVGDQAGGLLYYLYRGLSWAFIRRSSSWVWAP